MGKFIKMLEIFIDLMNGKFVSLVLNWVDNLFYNSIVKDIEWIFNNDRFNVMVI